MKTTIPRRITKSEIYIIHANSWTYRTRRDGFTVITHNDTYTPNAVINILEAQP